MSHMSHDGVGGTEETINVNPDHVDAMYWNTGVKWQSGTHRDDNTLSVISELMDANLALQQLSDLNPNLKAKIIPSVSSKPMVRIVIPYLNVANNFEKNESIIDPEKLHEIGLRSMQAQKMHGSEPVFFKGSWSKKEECVQINSSTDFADPKTPRFMVSLGSSSSRERLFIDRQHPMINDLYDSIKRECQGKSTKEILEIVNRKIDEITSKHKSVAGQNRRQVERGLDKRLDEYLALREKGAVPGKPHLPRNRDVPIEELMEAGILVCRHKGLLAATIMGNLVADKFLPEGNARQYRSEIQDETGKNIGAHTWAVYREAGNGNLWVNDPRWAHVKLVDKQHPEDIGYGVRAVMLMANRLDVLDAPKMQAAKKVNEGKENAPLPGSANPTMPDKKSYIESIKEKLAQGLPMHLDDAKKIETSATIEAIVKALEKCSHINNVHERVIDYLMLIQANPTISNDARAAIFKVSNDIIDAIPPLDLMLPTVNQGAPQKNVTFRAYNSDSPRNLIPPSKVDNYSASGMLKGILDATPANETGHNYFSITATMFARGASIADKSRMVSPMFSTLTTSTNPIENEILKSRGVDSFKKYIQNQLADINSGNLPIPRRLLIPLGLPGHECGMTVNITMENGKPKSEVLFMDPLGSPSAYRGHAQPFIDAVTSTIPLKEGSQVLESNIKYQDTSKGDYNCGSWTMWYLLEQASQDKSLEDLATQDMRPSNAFDINAKRKEFRDTLVKARNDVLVHEQALNAQPQIASPPPIVASPPPIVASPPPIVASPPPLVPPPLAPPPPMAAPPVDRDVFLRVEPAPVFTPHAKQAIQPHPAVLASQTSIQDLVAALEQPGFQAAHGIKSIDKSQMNSATPQVSMTIALNNNETFKAYAEQASPQGGIKVSMDKIEDKAKREEALDKICKAQVDALKPGETITVASTNPDKEYIEKSVEKAMKERAQREPDFKLPVNNAPKAQAS